MADKPLSSKSQKRVSAKFIVREAYARGSGGRLAIAFELVSNQGKRFDCRIAGNGSEKLPQGDPFGMIQFEEANCDFGDGGNGLDSALHTAKVVSPAVSPRVIEASQHACLQTEGT
jgi:hypothetical protein